MDPFAKFGPIWCASGAMNFFGEGYPYHKLVELTGLTWKGVTLVTKTSTLKKNEGLMPLKEDGVTPVEFKPKCIATNFFKAGALNAVALSGPGIEFLVDQRKWQKMIKRFLISIMAIGKTVSERFQEICEFRGSLLRLLREAPHLREILGLQINYSCPNTGHDMSKLLDGLMEEALAHFSVLSSLYLPIMPKLNIFMPPSWMVEFEERSGCNGVCISNTIPWDNLPDRIKKQFSNDGVSPLVKRGLKIGDKPQSGGYSGKELLPLTETWVRRARSLGFKGHINAGGGVLAPDDVDFLRRAGADSVFIGSIAFLRWWRMQDVIDRAYKICK